TLIAGTYTFKVTITSTSGGTTSDQMTLTVNAGSTNTVFTASAGPDIWITLPANSWKIVGTCIVKGLSVKSCTWKQVSGPSTATISGSGSISPVVSNLIAGAYYFEVDITSTNGLTASDVMILKVNPSGTSYSAGAATANAATITTSSATVANLTLYPNPVTAGQQITLDGQGVKTGTVKIAVIDLSGRQVKQLVVENTSESSFHQTIPTDGLARGMYVLTLAVGTDAPQQFKFVVQ
ncbi:MAG TPA: T9SS type A sorting domain-containing protein, partial [Puia sp.]